MPARLLTFDPGWADHAAGLRRLDMARRVRSSILSGLSGSPSVSRGGRPTRPSCEGSMMSDDLVEPVDTALRRPG